MHKFTILIAVISAMTFLVACDRSAHTPDNGGIPIELDKRYIQFDAGIRTRGINEGTTLQENFNVLGYQYTTTWENEKLLAAPNVFVSGSSTIQPQLVQYRSATGLFEYTPLQSWTSNKYSFFAYYPASNSSIKAFGNSNNNAKQGQPYITYDLPSTSSSSSTNRDPSNMIDVMTASVIDTDVSNSTVGLHMLHRLSAVDVSIRNYDKYTYNNNEYELEILISSLTITFTRMNTSVTIYLDPSVPSVPTSQNGNNLRIYNIVGNTSSYSTNNPLSISYNPDEKVVVKKNNTNKTPLTMLLIPQVDLNKEGYLEGKISITYRKRFTDNNGRTRYINSRGNASTSASDISSTINFTFDRQLEEGRRYEIVFNFASDDVAIQVDPIADWDTKDVDHEFI